LTWYQEAIRIGKQDPTFNKELNFIAKELSNP